VSKGKIARDLYCSLRVLYDALSARGVYAAPTADRRRCAPCFP